MQPLLSYVGFLKSRCWGRRPPLVMEKGLFDWFSDNNYTSLAKGFSIVAFVFSTWRVFVKRPVGTVTVGRTVFFLLIYIYLLF